MLFFAQFREGSAIFYTRDEWFNEDELPANYRRAKIRASSVANAKKAFATLEQAAREADPTIDFSKISPLVETF